MHPNIIDLKLRQDLEKLAKHYANVGSDVADLLRASVELEYGTSMEKEDVNGFVLGLTDDVSLRVNRMLNILTKMEDGITNHIHDMNVYFKKEGK